MSRQGKIIGYIVYAKEGVFHEADQREDVPEVKGTTLWFGGGATLFRSRRAAAAAIERTKKFRQIWFPKRHKENEEVDGNPERYWPWMESLY